MGGDGESGKFARHGRVFGGWLLFALIGSGGLLSPAEARQPFEVWKDCRLQKNESNDGDSFHVKSAKRAYIIRLYLVDAPETDTSFRERVAEQGKHFGISEAQTLEVGQAARRFMEEKLARPFTVRTARHDAMGRSKKQRYYGFVETPEGDLGELLVANGLARVHGVAPAAEGSASATA